MASQQVIYEPWNSGLGDRWATMNLLMAMADQQHAPVCLHSSGERSHLNDEIIGSLATSGSIVATDRPATHRLDGYSVWAAPSARVRRVWLPYMAHQLVCYHFDGLSSAAEKNPNQEELNTLLRALSSSGFAPIALGPHLSIDQAIQVMCSSAFFVGVDSGFSHIAHSVGLPTFLLEFELPIITCHRGKPFIQCGSRHEGRYAVEEFLRHKLPTHVDLLRFIGHPDGARSTIPVGRDAREAQGERWWVPAT